VTFYRIFCFCFPLLLLSQAASSAEDGARAQSPKMVPSFRVDPFWPKTLPNKWLVGAVAGVAADAQDHIWIIHRPSTLQPNETRAGWHAAPPVVEFDQAGNVIATWGGPGPGYEWPELEHGIYVDAQNNVWIAGAGPKDAQILKFTWDGKFLLQIGHSGQGHGSNDTKNLGAPANMVVDEAARELYVADGYVNHRIIVFDADTGAYKRHWGAYVNRRTTPILRKRERRSLVRLRERCNMKTGPVNMIPMVSRPRNFASFMRSGFHTTGLYTPAIERTIAFRSSRRTAPSSRKGSLRDIRLAAVHPGILPFLSIPHSAS
jgi:hypothetical protein